MMKIRIYDRILLLLTGLLAAWQVAVGIEGVETLPMIAYTVGFGVLLIASLLLLILGFEALGSPAVVIASTIIPLSLSLGLVWEYLPVFRVGYLAYAIFGFLSILLTRVIQIHNKLPIFILAFVHGIAGLTIFLLPITWAMTGRSSLGFGLVGIGGALIGVGGLLLSFLKTGRPLLPQASIDQLLPGLLFLMTVAFVAGFALA